MIKTKSKYILIALISVLFSCGDDPLEFKEQLIEWKKTHEKKNKDNPDENPEEETPDTPDTDTDTPDDGNKDTDTTTALGTGNNDGNTTEKLEVIHYNFDTWKNVIGTKYSVPVMSPTENTKNSYWVSASNYGYKYANAKGECPVTELSPSKKGSGIRMETKEALKNLVAGSLYIGHIQGDMMTMLKKNPTRFGRDFDKEPVKLNFFYQYQTGIKKRYHINGADKGEVRAILYEVTDNKNFYLDKYSVDKDDYKVLEARIILENQRDWKEETINFKVVNQKHYKALDFRKRKYRLTIMFSSSVGGGHNSGIVGSVLKIDEVSLYVKKK